MKIVQIIAPSPMGGAEQVVLDLCRALAGEGEEVHLVPILDQGAHEHPFLRGVPASVQLHTHRFPPRAYREERRMLATLLGEIAPDVVHTHGYRSDVVDAPVARTLGIPTVATVHGFTGGGWKNRVYQWLQLRAFRRFDGVVPVSRPLASQLERSGVPRERLHTIPNIRIPEEAFLAPAEARAQLGADADGFHVGWVGRITSEKGPDVLLDAFELLADAPFTASVVGDGRLREGLAARTAQGPLDGRVRWVGGVPEAYRILPGFDLLVLSSRTEGTPMVLLEAMAAGVPIVTTRVGGIPDVVSDEEAILVAPEDPRALADAIRSVIEDPPAARARAGRAAARFRETSTPARWAERYLEVYRRAGGRASASEAAR